ncbi:unnamed protein product, partial [Meganyctiphanes norvegica]
MEACIEMKHEFEIKNEPDESYYFHEVLQQSMNGDVDIKEPDESYNSQGVLQKSMIEDVDVKEEPDKCYNSHGILQKLMIEDVAVKKEPDDSYYSLGVLQKTMNGDVDIKEETDKSYNSHSILQKSIIEDVDVKEELDEIYYSHKVFQKSMNKVVGIKEDPDDSYYSQGVLQKSMIEGVDVTVEPVLQDGKVMLKEEIEINEEPIDMLDVEIKIKEENETNEEPIRRVPEDTSKKKNSGKIRNQRGSKNISVTKNNVESFIINDDVTMDENDEEEYEVEHIVDYKKKKGCLLYRVRWRNYNAKDDTWEPAENLTSCGDVYRDFLQQKIREKINAFSNGTKIPEIPRDPQLVEVLHEAFQREVFQPTESDWQQAGSKINTVKLPRLKSMKEIYNDMNIALLTNVKIIFDIFLRVIVEQLTFKKWSDQREIQVSEFQTQENNINNLCGDTGKTKEGNLVGYELFPEDFRYGNAYFNPFNIANGDSHQPILPEQTAQVHMSSGLLQHSIPVVELQQPFIPTYMGEKKLRRFHRPPLKRYSHGPVAATGPHQVLSLTKEIQKETIIRDCERLVCSENEFFMRTPQDLSGKDGDIIMVEYCEEFPPLLSQ